MRHTAIRSCVTLYRQGHRSRCVSPRNHHPRDVVGKIITHDRISTDPAPAAVGAYSQETATGDLVFTAGQVPLPPEDDLLDGTDIDSFGSIVAH